MKITTLLGSARKKGNTATALGWAEDELKAQGHEVKRVYLNNKSVNGCLGCNKCKKNPDEFHCVHKDDAAVLLKDMLDCDVIIYASPIYFWSFTAQMKGIIDRSYAYVTDYGMPSQTSLMVGKKVGLLVTGADAYENNAEGMFTSFKNFSGFLMAKKSEELYIGACSEPEKLSEETKSKAVNFANALIN